MISFDLQCQHGHVFEIWFRSSADYEGQRARRLINCPVCNDDAVTKAVMAPNVGAKANRAAGSAPAANVAAPHAAALPLATAPPCVPPELATALAALAQAQADALPRSRWVGQRFAREVRAADAAAQADGTPPPAIHGQATRAEAEALLHDGIAVMPLLVPFVPPDAQN